MKARPLSSPVSDFWHLPWSFVEVIIQKPPQQLPAVTVKTLLELMSGLCVGDDWLGPC
jgi:hypothetical protein